jgi:hypothetical protein
MLVAAAGDLTRAAQQEQVVLVVEVTQELLLVGQDRQEPH